MGAPSAGSPREPDPLLRNASRRLADGLAAAERARREIDAEEWRRLCRNPPRVRWSRLPDDSVRLGGW